MLFFLDLRQPAQVDPAGLEEGGAFGRLCLENRRAQGVKAFARSGVDQYNGTAQRCGQLLHFKLHATALHFVDHGHCEHGR